MKDIMIEKELCLQQYKKLNREADYLYDLSRQLARTKNELAANWHGSEADTVYKQLDDISYILRRLNYELTEFGHSYLKQQEEKEFR